MDCQAPPILDYAIQHGSEMYVDAALADVAGEFAAGAEDAADGAAMRGAGERGGDVVAVFRGMNPAEGGGPKAREAAAASRTSEMMAACIIFAAAFSRPQLPLVSHA